MQSIVKSLESRARVINSELPQKKLDTPPL